MYKSSQIVDKTGRFVDRLCTSGRSYPHRHTVFCIIMRIFCINGCFVGVGGIFGWWFFAKFLAFFVIFLWI